MSKEEIHHYIQACLKAANCSQSVFEEEAIVAILNVAGGVPRLISKICDGCLLIGDTKSEHTITSDIVMMAINEIELD